MSVVGSFNKKRLRYYLTRVKWSKFVEYYISCDRDNILPQLFLREDGQVDTNAIPMIIL